MEILRAESPCLEEGKGNGISERHLKRRRRSGSASDRARFRLIGKQQDIIGVAGQKTIAPLRHTRNRDPMPRSEQDDIVQLGRFAELEKAMTASCRDIIPKSPWLASAGWMK